MPYRLVLECHEYETCSNHVYHSRKRMLCRICGKISRKLIVEHIDTVRLLEL